MTKKPSIVASSSATTIPNTSSSCSKRTGGSSPRRRQQQQQLQQHLQQQQLLEQQQQQQEQQQQQQNKLRIEQLQKLHLCDATNPAELSHDDLDHILRYVDHGNDKPPGNKQHGSSALRHRCASWFINRLVDMLSDAQSPTIQHIIAWQPHGRCFVLKNNKLLQEILPNYFKITKTSSFLRQLNIYGFTRIAKGPDAAGYYHPRFLRGKRWLAQTITPYKVKGTRTRTAAKPTPNFWSMPFVTSDDALPVMEGAHAATAAADGTTTTPVPVDTANTNDTDNIVTTTTTTTIATVKTTTVTKTTRTINKTTTTTCTPPPPSPSTAMEEDVMPPTAMEDDVVPMTATSTSIITDTSSSCSKQAPSSVPSCPAAAAAALAAAATSATWETAATIAVVGSSSNDLLAHDYGNNNGNHNSDAHGLALVVDDMASSSAAAMDTLLATPAIWATAEVSINSNDIMSRSLSVVSNEAMSEPPSTSSSMALDHQDAPKFTPLPFSILSAPTTLLPDVPESSFLVLDEWIKPDSSAHKSSSSSGRNSDANASATATAASTTTAAHPDESLSSSTTATTGFPPEPQGSILYDLIHQPVGLSFDDFLMSSSSSANNNHSSLCQSPREG